MSNILKAVISVTIPLATGFLGAIFTNDNLAVWYTSLNKPALNPPNWIFGPVWTTLYVLMGLAFYLIWIQDTKLNKTHTYTLYSIQLILNLIWSYIFFTLRLPPIALVEIIILWLAVALTMVKFRAINKTAAYLFIPYIFWVSFATYLNYQIVLLN